MTHSRTCGFRVAVRPASHCAAMRNPRILRKLNQTGFRRA
jgi:hypothetical protein